MRRKDYSWESVAYVPTSNSRRRPVPGAHGRHLLTIDRLIGRKRKGHGETLQMLAGLLKRLTIERQPGMAIESGPGLGVALIQHLFKLDLGIALEADKFDTEPMIPLPANRCDGDVDRTPCSGELNMHTEMVSDLCAQIRRNLAAGDGEIGHRPGSVAPLAAQSDGVVYFDSRPTAFMHIETSLP